MRCALRPCLHKERRTVWGYEDCGSLGCSDLEVEFKDPAWRKKGSKVALQP